MTSVRSDATRGQKVGDRFVGAKARGLAVEQRGWGGRRDALAELWDDLDHVGGTGAERAAEPLVVEVRGKTSEDLNPRPEGGRALQLVAVAPAHLGAARAGEHGELLGKAGLADARLAREQHEPALLHGGGSQRLLERRHLGVTTHECAWRVPVS
jgi:hypothetical protein